MPHHTVAPEHLSSRSPDCSRYVGTIFRVDVTIHSPKLHSEGKLKLACCRMYYRIGVRMEGSEGGREGGSEGAWEGGKGGRREGGR